MKRSIAMLCLCWTMVASAGVVTLKDGTTLEGKIQATRDGFVVVDASGKATIVAAADVQSMQPDRANAAPRSPEQELAALRGSVAGVRDPQQAVDRYNAFIQRQAKGAPAALEAAKDLAIWQDRANHGLVRIGDDWLTPAQVAERQKQGLAVAAEAAPLIAAGQPGAAEARLDKALLASPGNPALLYLKGLVLIRQNKLVPARKAFEAVEAALPDHAATHNNLAVILWQTRAQMPAMGQYEKAMMSDPENQQVLDNVVEALHQLPPTAAKNELVRKVVALFTEQDTALQKKMLAERGLHRFGAQWMPSDQFEAMQAAQKAALDKLELYRKESIDLPIKLSQLDADIAIKTNALNGMLQQQLAIGATGQLIELPLPQHYYELKQEVETMSADRAMKQRRLDQLPKLISDAQQQASIQGGYTGHQLPFDERWMPGASPAAATQPATKP